ncbi:neuronal acetylcholine receptor subunit alpha-7-like [Mytilus galloprovincialis]|uniref:neuronal acetylcholine receptor subunit alpha-7-like n=1 Tax=Mytilus galloprovincialis TaxID=29158 RepID=UPI003F7C9A42
MRTAFQILFTLMLKTVIHVSCSSMTDVSNLHTTLLQNYNSEVRPGDNQLVPTNINVTFNLVAIQEFDEVDGKFAVIGFFEVTWVDSRMSWNPSDYNYTNTMLFSQNVVWKPTLLSINPFSKIDQLGKDFMTVRYYPNGFAYWSPGEVLSSSCSVDVTYFPFDQQTCIITLMSWGTWPNEILLQSPLTNFKMGFYSEHGTWQISSTSAVDSTSTGMSVIDLSVTMERRPAFFVVNIVLPVMFLMALNCCVFILPPESGERVSYSITVLLAIAVFMTLTGDNLPKTSEPMSLLSYFLMSDLVFSAVICLITMLGLRLHYKDDKHHVPSYLKRVVCFCKCSSNQKQINDVRPFCTDEKIQQFSDFNRKDNMSADSDVSWKDVSKALDTILLWISIGGLVISIILFFIILKKLV